MAIGIEQNMIKNKIIYKITNVINNKTYVGCTFDLSKRKYAHKMHSRNGTYKEGNKLYPDILKFGLRYFVFDKIEEYSVITSKERERYWIEKLGSYKYGYNTSPHGLCGKGFWKGKKRPDISLMKKGRIDLIKNAIHATKKKILCIGNGEVFESATEASNKNHRTNSAIAYVARNGTKCAGFKWAYIN